MASPPLSEYVDRTLGTGAVTAATDPIGGATRGDEERPHHQEQQPSPGHLRGFDGTLGVSFHPATQSFERTERRHTSSRSIFPTGVSKVDIEMYEAGNPRVKGKNMEHPCTIWVGVDDESSAKE